MVNKGRKSKLAVDEMIALKNAGVKLKDIAKKAGVGEPAVSVAIGRRLGRQIAAGATLSDEFTALQVCVASLERLSADERQRIMAYLNSRFAEARNA